MIGIPLGLASANAFEWAMHKYVLHGRGKRKSSYWSFHWGEHHQAVRKNGHVDPVYHRPMTEWHAASKEAALLLGGVAITLPLTPVAPFFVGTIVYSAVNYYRVHKKSHLDPEWAREHLPWHYDHHMGPNQDANWCVTRPWTDRLMGTRIPYVGTEKELNDRARQAARAARARKPRPEVGSEAVAA